MRRSILLALALAIALGGTLTGLLVAGAIGQNSGSRVEPPVKQTIEAQMTVQQATVLAAVPPGSTKSVFTPRPTLASCPIDPTSVRTYVGPAVHQLPVDPAHLQLVNEATGHTAEGAPYSIWSGVLTSDPEQGVIGVWLGAKDPCAEGRTDYNPQEYLTPFKGGAVTLTSVTGDTVDFRTADGTTGRLDYLAGTFH